MAEIKCPTCGAGIDSDGKFCKYCGTKLPDDTQRINVSGVIDHNVNIRKESINQTRIAKAEIRARREEAKAAAEAQRIKNLAEYERERRETIKHNNKVSLIACGVLLLISIIWIMLNNR